MPLFHPQTWLDHARSMAAHPHLPDAVSLALVAALGWQLADLAWAALPAPAAAVAPVAAPTETRTERPDADAAGERLARLHLFGEVDAPTETKPDDDTDAPETQLNLALKGLYAPGDGRGFAIIAAGSGPERVYGVSDTVAGGARITGIFDDRVVLQRDGRAETLRLPGAKSAPASTQAARRGNRQVEAGMDSIARRAGEFRARLMENPLELARMVRFQPYVEDGDLVGYRVQPRAAEAELLSELGLQATDVVTRINDIALNAPEQATRALQSLRDARTIDITLLRDGRSQRMSIPVGQPG